MDVWLPHQFPLSQKDQQIFLNFLVPMDLQYLPLEFLGANSFHLNSRPRILTAKDERENQTC